jgi:hypothetical protein
MQDVIITQKANELDWVSERFGLGKSIYPQLICFHAVTLDLTRRISKHRDGSHSTIAFRSEEVGLTDVEGAPFVVPLHD